MNRTSLRRLAVPGVAALTLSLAVSACGAGNESSSGGGGGKGGSSLSGQLKGAGSSAQQTAMEAWRGQYQTKNSGVTINYDPSGSGAGVEQFNGGATDFAGSDSALDPSKGEVQAAKKRCKANALEVPDYVSPIAIVFNVPGVKKLQLDAPTLAKIFQGKVTKWNDPSIMKLNQGTKLPALKISPVHRSDESGTTKNTTEYLNAAAPSDWTQEPDKVWPLKGGEGANGTSGVVSAIKSGKGSIGYADNSETKGLTKVSIKVGNAYVAPSAQGAAKALQASPMEKGRTPGDLAVKVDRTTTASGAYPLMLVSYLITCPTYPKAKADLVKSFVSYVVSSQGQQAAAKNAGSAPLPSAMQQKASKVMSGIKAK